jgi:hypothetical protein
MVISINSLDSMYFNQAVDDWLGFDPMDRGTANRMDYDDWIRKSSYNLSRFPAI